MINTISFATSYGISVIRIPNKYYSFDVLEFFTLLNVKFDESKLLKFVDIKLLEHAKSIFITQHMPITAEGFIKFVDIVQATLDELLPDPNDRLTEYNQDWISDVLEDIRQKIEEYGTGYVIPSPVPFVEIAVLDTANENPGIYNLYHVRRDKYLDTGALMVILQVNYNPEMYYINNYGTILIIEDPNTVEAFKLDYMTKEADDFISYGLDQYLNVFLTGLVDYADRIRVGQNQEVVNE